MPNAWGCQCFYDADEGAWVCLRPGCEFTTNDDLKARQHGMTGGELLLDLHGIGE